MQRPGLETGPGLFIYLRGAFAIVQNYDVARAAQHGHFKCKGLGWKRSRPFYLLAPGFCLCYAFPMVIAMQDVLQDSIVDHTVTPVICGPIGSAGPVTHGKPRNVDYFCALLAEADEACYGGNDE